MASVANCGSSTVLGVLRVTTTVGFLVPGECRATKFFAALATRPSAPTLRRLWVPGAGCRLGGGKFEIRNSKFEISGVAGHEMNRHSLQFYRLLGFMSEQLKNSLSLFFTSSILLGVRSPLRVSSCVEVDKL